MEQVFQSELLQGFADKLKAAGMKVYYSPSKDNSQKSWFYFTDGKNIGYCQEAYFGGLEFTTVHRPCRECGSGFSATERLSEPTIEDAKKAFITAPNWARPQDVQAVRKYSNIEELISKDGILKYVEY